MKKLNKTNPSILNLIDFFIDKGYSEKTPLWIDLSKRFKRPTRHLPQVNLSKINRYSQEGDTVLIPGKVLGSGELDHNVTVSAFKFSKSAMEKINKNGRAITLYDLYKENPRGSGVKIMEWFHDNRRKRSDSR